jgi:hypothetical protein
MSTTIGPPCLDVRDIIGGDSTESAVAGIEALGPYPVNDFVVVRPVGDKVSLLIKSDEASSILTLEALAAFRESPIRPLDGPH